MKITDAQILETVNLYLSFTGDTREHFLDSLSELAQHHAADRFEQIKTNTKILQLASSS